MDASVIAALIGAGGAGTIAVVGNVIISRISGARTEGVITESINGIRGRLTKIETEQQQQWAKIGENTEDIGYLKGRLNGRQAKHAEP